ncbi:hypothetical protein AL755_12795 [Arthrobacter sp. ERGS1:01]|uniref:hypothetical protein n=1 Tax=Arthrobacter sp. ERGS1:01 TaxID=1704044 RepID=UPI0006B58869|nr:hypothetical protein [Arthrobacter sp. ERGS1:01]ALE06143.1 hypothetical protein AL755_12795 [Arthrobacter sp. ERGS1:01]
MSPANSTAQASLRDGLQAQIHLMQGRRGGEPSLPVLPVLDGVIPGGLRPGSVYSLQGSMSLAMALLAGPSLQGAWCGVAGLPDFGVEAAAGFGIDLDRLVLVPEPGERWMTVVATLTDVLSVVLACAPGHVAPAEAARLGARLREQSSVLLVLGPWPQSEAVLQVDGYQWEGLAQGRGHFTRQQLRLDVALRGGSRRASVNLAGGVPAGLHSLGA